MSDLNSVIAANLKRFRSERRMSLQEVADKAGLSKTHVYDVERGVGNPTVNTLTALGEAFGVSAIRMLRP